MLAVWAMLPDSLPVRASELVHFESAALPPSALKRRLAEQQGVALKPEPGAPLWGYLSKPEGVGPFGAVVMLHGCNGLPPGGPESTDWLTGRGFVTLQVDSVGPRHLKSGCNDEISASERALDAYGAAAFLQEQPDIDPGRIAVMGWSQGGSAAISAAMTEGVAAPIGRPFRAAVAFYPFCGIAKVFYAPLLVLIGAEDQSTPARFCQRAMAARSPESAPAEVIVYPGVHHAFMAARFRDGRALQTSRGPMWVQYDGAARQDAIERAKAFLEKHLN